MTGKLRLAVENLSYCGGCDVALASLGPALLDLLDTDVDLVYAPLLMSAKDYGDVEVVLLTGAVRTVEDVEKVERARARALYLAAFGACACFGGLPGLANLADEAQMLSTAYREAPSLGEGGGPPVRDVPALVAQIKPVAAYVDVDFVLPGCPPPPDLIAQFLSEVLERAYREEE